MGREPKLIKSQFGKYTLVKNGDVGSGGFGTV